MASPLPAPHTGSSGSTPASWPSSPRYVDLSHPVSEETPPFPGDPPVEVTILDATDRSDQAPRSHLNCSRIAMCVHCGTHMDAPFHFFGNGQTIDTIPLETTMGPATVITLELDKGAAENVIDAATLEPFAPQFVATGRVLLHTGWHRRWGTEEYFERHPVLTRRAAALLVQSGVGLLAVDFPSVDQPPHEAHLELLGNGVVIVENITNLDELTQSTVHITAIPLALVGRDGSPVRVVAQSLS